MRNQPFQTLIDLRRSPQGSALIDPPLSVRFVALAGFFVVAAAIVLIRIAWVQATLRDAYLDVLSSTTVEYEWIPARCGRILDERANVYAVDVDQYSIQMHYRWLQEPPDQAWLNRTVRKRLTEEERHDPFAMQRHRSELLNERKLCHQRICDLTGLTRQEFDQRRAEIQRRVQRISESVNRRHQRIHPEGQSAASGQESSGLLFSFARALRSALTTAPGRQSDERIVVREEESFHELTGNVPFDVAAQINELPHMFPGVRIVTATRRTYPQKSLAAHIVGARTPADHEDTPTVVDGDLVHGTWEPTIGRFGVERSYHHVLRSVAGLRKVVRSYRREVIESAVVREPVSGHDVVLTINMELQRVAEELLAESLLDRPPTRLRQQTSAEDEIRPQSAPVGGCVVAMDVRSGRLLAVASAPSFDLSLFVGGSAADWQRMNADHRMPFLSRSTAMAIPPGSVMKIVAAAAGIESGRLDPDRLFHCQGYLDQPDSHRCLIFRLFGRGHKEIRLKEALSQSCNVYFFDAARRTGYPVLHSWFERFGCGQKTGIDIPFERPGHLARVADTAVADQTNEAMGLAVGQATLTMTPLQVVRILAAVANGGWLVTPHVVSTEGVAHTARDADRVATYPIPRHRIPGLSSDTLHEIQEALRATVESPAGTAFKTVRLADVRIAGKTGTAETGESHPDHAWFAGYVPAEQPRVAFVVVLEHGGSGSRSAGPVARELVRAMNELGLLAKP